MRGSLLFCISFFHVKRRVSYDKWNRKSLTATVKRAKMTSSHLNPSAEKEEKMPRVTEEYYEKKKQEIIDAACRVCARKPITSVEMKDVIGETGFSHGVVYRYYKDLDDVLRDLVVRINRENAMGKRLHAIVDGRAATEWKTVLREVCDMLADYLKEVGTDILKISLYSDVLAMSDPERVKSIADKIGKEESSPLLELTPVLGAYLMDAILKNALVPMHSVDEILQFIIASYHGIQTGYVLSTCYDSKQLEGKYNPKAMFSCLADSVILMLDRT